MGDDNRRSAKMHKAAVAGAIGVVLAAVGFCAPLIVGRVPYWADLSQVFYPLMDHVARGLSEGLPHPWYPHLAGGYFVHGATQANMAYPVTWLIYGIIPMPWAFSFSYLFHLLAGCLGFYFLLRLNSVHPVSAIFGAVLYSFNGYAAGHHIHTNIVVSLGLLPWVLCACHWFIRQPSLLRTSVFGLALGVMAVGAHPQWLWIGGIIVLLYTLLAPSATAVSSVWRRVGQFVIVAVIAALIGAVQLLPAGSTAAGAKRGANGGRQFATSYSLQLGDIPRLLLPNIHGNPVDGDTLCSPSKWWETAGFVGAAGLCISLFCFVACGYCRYQLLSVILVAGGLFMAVGKLNPLYGYLSRIPLIGGFRGPARYLLLAVVGVAMAAAKGHDTILRGTTVRPRVGRRIGVMAAGAIIMLILLGNGVFAGFRWALTGPLQPSSLTVTEKVAADVLHNYFVSYEPIIIGISALVAGIFIGCSRLNARKWIGGLVLIVAICELAAFWHSFFPTAAADYYKKPPGFLQRAHQQQNDDEWSRIVVVAAPEVGRPPQLQKAEFSEYLAPIWGIDSCIGLDTLQPWGAVTMRNRAAAAFHSGAAEDMKRAHRMCDIFGVRWIVSTDGLSKAGLSPTAESRVLYENSDALPLAYVATDMVPAPAMAQQQAAVERESFRAGVDCAMDPADAKGISTMRSQTSDEAARCSIIRNKPGHLTARVKSGRPAILVYQQNWHRDWQATVDGKPAEVFRCNAINMGVAVPACADGCTVKMDFISGTTRIGAVISLATVLLCLAAMVTGYLMKARRGDGG